jgi:hypothetical protein
MNVTILSMLHELNSFIDCKRYFEEAKDSKINVKNNTKFRELVKEWMEGKYDECPELIVQRITFLL